MSFKFLTHMCKEIVIFDILDLSLAVKENNQKLI